MLQPVESDSLNKYQAVKPWEEDRSQLSFESDADDFKYKLETGLSCRTFSCSKNSNFCNQEYLQIQILTSLLTNSMSLGK